MTNLYIKVINGKTVDHPVLAQNLFDVFPGVPAEQFPALGYEPFVRVELLVPQNKRFIRTEYEKIDGVWTDVHYFEDLSPEEIAAIAQRKRQLITEWWQSRPEAFNYTAWVYDEALERFVPPFPKPDDGQFYRWSGKDNNWKLAEPFPQDGKRYTFDFNNWTNVEVPTNV